MRWLAVSCVLTWTLALQLEGAALGPRQPSWSDWATLDSASAINDVDPYVVRAIAWEESRDNMSPRLRGHHCWHGPITIHDGDWYLVLPAVHERNCEVGRFQIKPSTGRKRCPGVDIWTYHGNLTCFYTMFVEDATNHGLLAAIRMHNGHGDQADDYQRRVLSTYGWLMLTDPVTGGDVK